ncbi:MAG: NRDE family protein [Saprospiraceae bacterium]|nr:NRDE family protein [Saprospiraceae bacterium]
MCTVTYLPRPSGFILTHNRDEAPSRSSQVIIREKTPGGHTLLFPRDEMAGGTWIATSREGRTACLLNGAFVLHKRELPYRRSRGLILLDFFDWENPDDFFQHYDFEGVEPFTFLFFDRGHFSESLVPKKSGSERAIPRILEFRWDGLQRYLENLPVDQAHFWCSATLYPAEMQVRRELVFRDWLTIEPITNPPITSQIFSLHLTGSIGDPENNYVMSRAGKVQTVSITQVIVDEKSARMRYLDLLGGKRSERRLTRNKRVAITVNR